MPKISLISFLMISVISSLSTQERRSVNEAKGLPVGSKAPTFKAKDVSGKAYDLAEALNNGPVVLIFYRGQWCPYCNRHLRTLQDSLSLIYEKGAAVVAVSPEKPEYLKKTAEKTRAQFSLLHDEGYAIANAYDVTFGPGEKQLQVYNETLGADLIHAQSDDSQRLPVPATYIIGQNGIILWRHFDADYRKRSTTEEILKNLPQLKYHQNE